MRAVDRGGNLVERGKPGRLKKKLYRMIFTAGLSLAMLEQGAGPVIAAPDAVAEAAETAPIIEEVGKPGEFAKRPADTETVSSDEFRNLLYEEDQDAAEHQDDLSASETVSEQAEQTGDGQALTMTMPEDDGYYMVTADDKPLVIAEADTEVTLSPDDGTLPVGTASLQILYSEEATGSYQLYDYAGEVEVQAGSVDVLAAPLFDRNSNLFSQLPTDQASLSLLKTEASLQKNYFPDNITPSYPRIQSSSDKIKEKTAEVLAQNKLTLNSPDSEKTKAIYLFVINHVYYDTDYANKRKEERPADDAIGVLDSGIAVCEGYASLLSAMLRAADVPALKVDGYSGASPENHLSDNPNHAWVAAYFEDAPAEERKWQLMDPTWDSKNVYAFGQKNAETINEVSSVTCPYYCRDVDTFSAYKRFDNFDSEVLPNGAAIKVEPSSLLITAPNTASFHAYVTPLWADQKTSWRLYASFPGYSGCYKNESAIISNGLNVSLQGVLNGSGCYRFTLQNLEGTCPVTIKGPASQSGQGSSGQSSSGQSSSGQNTPGQSSAGENSSGQSSSGQNSSGQSQQKQQTEEIIPTQNMYRLFNPLNGEHFYTANTGERDHLAKIGWNYEGVGWVAPVYSNTPVYRLFNRFSGDHHYTTNAGERDWLVKLGWNYEGIGWYSDDRHRVPLYRQFNPFVKIGTHNYTKNKGENDYLTTIGWRAEGIGWYGVG